MEAELERAIHWALGLNSSTSSNWPTTPSDEEIKWLKLLPGQYWTGPKEMVILVINKHGDPQAFQREWNPKRLWPQTKETLVARIFHIDETITVVLEDDYCDLIPA